MKQDKFFKSGLALIGGVALCLSAVVSADIRHSPHDLSVTTTSGGAAFITAEGTSEVCVFCHTPHGASEGIVPLWNRNLASPPAYETYDMLGTSTLDGGVEPVGSVSLACLSCHDGVTALNAIINAPGSGPNLTFGEWEGTWDPGLSGVSPATRRIATGNTLFGTDLTNDHPVGVQYAGGGLTYATDSTGTVSTTSYIDQDFQPVEKVGLATDTHSYWYVDQNPNARRDRNDIILYTRVATVGANIGMEQPYVECGSCHDPHETGSGTFLRTTNDGSALCLGCHKK